MQTQKVLITGANKSIGLETARQLAAAGYHVLIGSRDKEKGVQAKDLLVSEGADAARLEVLVIDVADEASVKAAAQQVKSLDVLINNAGIPGKMPAPPSNAEDGNIHQVFETNFFGPVRMVRHFIDLLRQSSRPRIVNVTSDLASLTLQNDPGWVYYQFNAATYGPSKTALNAYTVALAKELKDTAFKVNAVNPGYTATDFNQHRGTKNVKDAAAVIVEYAMLDENGPTGKFVSDYGVSPW